MSTGGAGETGGAGGRDGSADGGPSPGDSGAPAGGSRGDASSTGGSPDADGGAADTGGSGGMAASAYKIYVGQTHAHSQLSSKSHDGVGPDGPATGFARARAAGADFYFITDHVDYGPISPADFATVEAAARAATTATFVALAGIEFHLSIHNEMNSFAIELDADHVGKATKVTGYQYADYLRTKYPGAFAQWTHPLRSGLENHEYKGRTAERDEVIALLEVLNGDDDPMESAYHQALDQGWHIGPAAGHDNHGQDWFTLPTRTGVLAASLTRENIHDGLRQSRVFCSQDAKMRVWYDINGTVMGATAPAAASYKATVRVEGATATSIELITRGGRLVTAGKPTNGVWSAALTGVTAGAFYYARLTSAGGKTWTAPVWIQ